VSTEEASHLFSVRFPAIEEPTRGEVVELAFHVELPVRHDVLFVWVVFEVTEAFEDVLCGGVLWLRRNVQSVAPFL
jgi:hypothetical protein